MDSRTKQRLSGLPVPYDTFLLSSILDKLNLIWWSKTKDAEKNRNRPKSLVQELLKKPKDDIEAFATGEDFMKEWQRLTG